MGVFTLNPLNARRWANFRANKRAFWSLRIFLVLFVVSLFAEFLANDKPLLIKHHGEYYAPVLNFYSERDFGGDFDTEADYRDKFVQDLIKKDGGWMVWPLIPFSYDTVSYDVERAPAPPSASHWLGADDQARDVVARMIYGFRISVLFGLTLAILSSIVGIAAGAAQGYFGGWVDLAFQRFIEIWGSINTLYLLMIVAAIVTPSFWLLLGLMLLFSWTGLVGVVRAEFLRARNFEYVRAAQAMGVSSGRIMWRHLLPNATVATITMAPFVVTGSIGALTSLDYLGFGLPPGSPSLGEMALQAQRNLQAPWLAFTSFVVTATMMSLLVFIFEGVRDAFDPRKTFS